MRPFARSLLIASGLAFAFDPLRKAATTTLSLNNTKATGTAVATFACAFGNAPAETTKTYVCTVNYTAGGGGVGIGAGNGSAGTGTQLGTTANSVALIYNGQVLVSGVNLLSSGLTITTGTVIRMQFNATQVRFSKNGGAYSSWVTHGVTGTLTPAINTYDNTEAVTIGTE